MKRKSNMVDRSTSLEKLTVAIAALNQYDYCPHRCWRMFCLSEFHDNEYTLEGTRLHERVHHVSDLMQGEVYQVRGIWLRSQQYGLVGKADLLEEIGGQWIPIEYKRHHCAKASNDAIQLCAQAFCLGEMTRQKVSIGFLYDTKSHHRQKIEISAELRQITLMTLDKVRSLLVTGTRPPAKYGPRCQGCSLYEVCMPRVLNQVERYQEVD